MNRSSVTGISQGEFYAGPPPRIVMKRKGVEEIAASKMKELASGKDIEVDDLEVLDEILANTEVKKFVIASGEKELDMDVAIRLRCRGLDLRPKS